MKVKALWLFLVVAGSTAAAAQDIDHPDHPCAPIAKVCMEATPPYVKKQHKEKNGLWLDCVKPLVDSNGKTVPPRVDAAKVAAIPATTYAACKAKRPKL